MSDDSVPLSLPLLRLAAGGSLTAGDNYSFQITPIWQNGGVGNRSASSRICTPTSGNQTININWTAAPGNPKDYRIFVFVNGLASFYLNTSLTGLTSFSWSGSTSTVGGSFPGIPGGGPTMLLPGAAGVSADRYIINGNCSSASDPSICGTAASGSVDIATGATTVTVKTTAVTANSQILLTFDSSLGTRLGVTCNTTTVQPTVSARTAGKSFVIKVPTAPTMNPACFSYTIVN